ncbi:MAG: sigma-70 family RNA polymerase sigma factor [Verrucomicrobiota bacterium]|jgi:RNA polymerase sigma factor (sigma-70 family)
MTSDLDLLGQYARNKAQDAFTEIVRRHVDLVYSAAVRQVRSPQLAEEVAQSVFTDLARNAGKLKPDTVLTAWLYQVTRRTAIDVVRRESRRQLREQIAVEMNAMNATASDWTHVEPFLDEAMHTLDDTDRTAVLLRYFENKSLREVGQALGTSEDTAQKRVSRAVERLGEFFSKRNVTVGTSGLAVLISANAVHAAPVGLAATISAAAVLAGTAISTSTIITATKTIAMTTIQKTLITAALAVVVGAGIYEAHQASNLRNQVQDQVQNLQQLQRERDDATNRLASLADELARVKKNPSEVLKLRGEVGALRQEKAIAGSQSALNKLTANPETRKALRDQQKMGMSAIYSDLVKRLNLTPEQAGQFNDLLADHVMDSIDLITQALHDNKNQGEIDQLFSAQNSALQDKLLALVGPDGLAQYLDYTKNLASTLTAAQFAGSLTGDPATVADKKSQLLQAMQQATQSALAAAGLPADYQTVPMLNFGNIASEEEGAQSLQLLDSIYGQVAASASTFLNADELNKFQEFRTNALKSSQTMLIMNRKLMAPISK